MHECWMPQPEQRPSFDEIVTRAERMLRQDLNQEDDYYVIPSERDEQVNHSLKLQLLVANTPGRVQNIYIYHSKVLMHGFTLIRILQV